MIAGGLARGKVMVLMQFVLKRAWRMAVSEGGGSKWNNALRIFVQGSKAGDKRGWRYIGGRYSEG